MKKIIVGNLIKICACAAIIGGLSSCSKEGDTLGDMNTGSTAGQRAVDNSGFMFYYYFIGVATDWATAVSAGNDTIDLYGKGTLEIHDKTATGGGYYTSTDASEGSGTWSVIELISFDPYGDDPATCVGSGGKAVFSIALDNGGDGTVDSEANLTIRCCGGNSPSGCDEGIRVDTKHINFNTEVDGVIVFEKID